MRWLDGALRDGAAEGARQLVDTWLYHAHLRGRTLVFRPVEVVPMQQGGIDCGVHVLYYGWRRRDSFTIRYFSIKFSKNITSTSFPIKVHTFRKSRTL
jgi:hypothetical protein